MRRVTRSILSLFLLTAFVLAACGTPQEATEAPSDPTTAPVATSEPQVDDAGEDDSQPAVVQSIRVSDQDVSGGVVEIDAVVSEGHGWLVIHITSDGGPGPIIGRAPVEPGTTENLVVEVDVQQATEQLFAMLHVDAGQTGEFEFPDGPDVPATQDGAVVNLPFDVILPEVMGETIVEVSESSLGEILVDAEGLSLYLFTNDTPGESNCYGNCAANWPPFIADGDFMGGDGIDADLLSTTTREDGALQVTYNDWPLYYYVMDEAPGDVTGQGVSGVWYVVSPAGEAVTAAGGDDLPDY